MSDTPRIAPWDRVTNYTDELKRENNQLRAEVERNRAIICATQEGRTQWNAAEVYSTNERLLKERDQWRECADRFAKGAEAYGHTTTLKDCSLCAALIHYERLKEQTK